MLRVGAFFLYNKDFLKGSPYTDSSFKNVWTQSSCDGVYLGGKHVSEFSIPYQNV